jgi:hypothetical protein
MDTYTCNTCGATVEQGERCLMCDQRQPVTLLLGAEGCSELENQPWIREATAEEERAFELYLREQKGLALNECTIDHNGRPYWVMTLLPDAPVEYLDLATRKLRTVRLEVL